VAYALLVAAREADGSYDAGGLELTMEWLERAQEVEPDVLEINVIEGLVYVYNGRLEDARLVLDYLEEQGARNHFLHRAEVAYWMQMGDVAQTIHWFNRAAESAENVPQRLGMKAQLGDYYFRQNMLDEALVVYQEAVHFDKNNPALWYKIAIIHWRGEVLEEAEISNNQALRVQPDYAPAVKLAEAIKKKKSESGRLGRLFGS
jgi:tetratricopeptide (TPR) repeat protein